MKTPRCATAPVLLVGSGRRPQVGTGAGGRMRCGPGLTLVELLISLTICALVLASAWPWCWRVSAVTTTTQRRTQVASALAYAERTFCADVRCASAIVAPPGAECSATRVTLAMVDPVTGAREEVTYAYDATRHVVWRKASGTYLVERVDTCRFCFFTADGAEVAASAGESLAASLVAVVRRIRLDISVDPDGDASGEWLFDASLRGGGSR